MSFDRTRPDRRYKYASVAEAQDARRQQARARYHRHLLTEPTMPTAPPRPGRPLMPVHQVIPTIPPPPKGVLAVQLARMPLRGLA